MKTATSKDWKIKPLPKKRSLIPAGHMQGRKIEWWMFIAPQELDGTFTLDALNATEALLISFWNEICHVTNDQRGKDKKPAFVHLQQGILFAEAASAALLWFIQERKSKELGFNSWSLPFKKCKAHHWPKCYSEIGS